MKPFLTFLFLFFISLFKSQTTQELALDLLGKLQREQFDSCVNFFDPSVRDKVNEDVLKEVWTKLPGFLGEFQSYSNVRSGKKEDQDEVLIACKFEKITLDLQILFTPEKKINYFYFLPPKSSAVYSPPSYYRPEKFYETKLNVKTGNYEMPGALCLPNNTNNPPVVILVAGSGPNDKDESAGPNKALKDLAIGLAANGIASFRYDKRTHVYGVNIAKDPEKAGMNEEVIEDVLSAVKILKQHISTKNSKIIVIGHSLGATCAPLIATKDKTISGIVMMAGNARPLEDLIPLQFEYIMGLDSVDKEEKENLIEVRKQISIVKDKEKLKKAKKEELPFGLSSAYWQSFVSYDQLKTSKKVKQPILILQGERDYQVTMVDFNLWKKELEGDSKNQFKSYPKLNHMFMPGEGKCVPEEYNKPNNVDEEVIRDISDWVKKLK
jgi:uncharacterized protein